MVAFLSLRRIHIGVCFGQFPIGQLTTKFTRFLPITFLPISEPATPMNANSQRKSCQRAKVPAFSAVATYVPSLFSPKGVHPSERSSTIDWRGHHVLQKGA